MTTKILLVDDHELFIEGLSMLINEENDLEVIGTTNSSVKVFEFVKDLKPDLIIMDISMPEIDGIEATAKIHKEYPNIKIIGLSGHDNKRYVLDMLKYGARGYILKKSALRELTKAIRSILKGQIYVTPEIANVLVEDYVENLRDTGQPVLTPRETEVLKFFAEGMSTKEIASKFKLSIKTIETHKKQIMEKLHISSLADLIKYAIRKGLTSI